MSSYREKSRGKSLLKMAYGIGIFSRFFGIFWIIFGISFGFLGFLGFFWGIFGIYWIFSQKSARDFFRVIFPSFKSLFLSLLLLFASPIEKRIFHGLRIQYFPILLLYLFCFIFSFKQDNGFFFIIFLIVELCALSLQEP